MTTTKIVVRHVVGPKEGEKLSDCEDSFGYRSSKDGHCVSAAISDGATEAAYSGLWAGELVSHFVAEPPALEPENRDQFTQWLRTPQEAWHKAVPWDRIPWHGIDKTRAGSLATLLGTVFSTEPGHLQAHWRAMVIGDCCAFITDASHRLLRAFPIDSADDFDNQPNLISSNSERNDGIEESISYFQGTLDQGQRMILATDAVAQWLLRKHQENDDRWREITELRQGELEHWLHRQRRGGGMKNDDATIVVIEAR